MRRAVITSAATVSGVVLLLSLKPHGQSTAGAPVSTGAGGGTSTASGGTAAGGDDQGGAGGGTDDGGTTGSTGSSGSSGTSGSSGSSGSSGTASGTARTVTGDAADTRYGPVQVKVSVQGKKITDISVVQYPNEDHRDQEINGYALPILNQEALSAQSARIDAVSGATYTSDGYTRSLQSALDRAGL
ncbi:FMN-binding protein [Streptacidiphilus sp. ASG 303]|uniref:FMN-binding protein n=1 Tax=Streptacidiphilus sp. ASG 303 TaxID=2896847 RepID=UPI001E3E710E|nr:FMN-binding protein [Streptacidiphilus sp. ASG 303]MCD0484452.1 FMN-binding protein [Streptacidiphilus sp. ASG 303]